MSVSKDPLTWQESGGEYVVARSDYDALLAGVQEADEKARQEFEARMHIYHRAERLVEALRHYAPYGKKAREAIDAWEKHA